MENAQRVSFYPKGSKVAFTSCILKDGAHDWGEEVGNSLRAEVVGEGVPRTSSYYKDCDGDHLHVLGESIVGSALRRR